MAITPYLQKGHIFCAVSAWPDFELRGYVLVPILKGYTPEQISGRLGKGIEIDVDLISTRAIQQGAQGQCALALSEPPLPPPGRNKRYSKDRIAGTMHVSERTQAAD